MTANKSSSSPTVSPQPKGLSPALERNIAAMQARREADERNASIETKVADFITRFVGSMPFVYLHLAVFGVWAAVNSGLVSFIPKWDESFVILGTTASVEAIFLSTFVLISQNRMSDFAGKRADLDLQISLLAEHELTRLIHIVSDLAEHVGLKVSANPELKEIKKDVAAEAVMDRIEK